VFGLRLGATLAALAAQGRDDVAALIALAPLVKGKGWVREGRILGQATLARTGLRSAGDTGGLEFGGFSLDAEDVAFVQHIDLLASQVPPARRMLLLDRDDMPSDPSWGQHLTHLGATVEQVQADGYHDMMQVPHFAQVPETLLARVVSWVGALAGLGGMQPVTVQHLRTSVALGHAPVVEEARWLPGSSPLSVVISQTARTVHEASAPAAVLMINTGGEHRIGTNRMYTHWARRWAERGWVAMRMDLTGLGESPARPGVAHDIHLRHATEDIERAIEHLRTHHGVGQVHLVGLCSGAFHAMSAAFQGVDLRSVTAINQMVYFWQPRMPMAGEASEAVVVAIAQGVGQALSDPQRWRKLLRGEVNVGVIVRALWRRAGQRLRLAARGAARQVRWPLAHDLHTALVQTARRGVHFHLVFSPHEPGRTLLMEHAAGAVARLVRANKLTLSAVDNSDHTFTLSEAQHRLFDVVDKQLLICAETACSTAPPLPGWTAHRSTT
jgi:pimeloyl-ACP methyl ester carboxylesterase